MGFTLGELYTDSHLCESMSIPCKEECVYLIFLMQYTGLNTFTFNCFSGCIECDNTVAVILLYIAVDVDNGICCFFFLKAKVLT